MAPASPPRPRPGGSERWRRATVAGAVAALALLGAGCTAGDLSWEEEWLRDRGAGGGELPELPFELGEVAELDPGAVTVHADRPPDELSEGEAFEVYASWLAAHEAMYADPDPDLVPELFVPDWRFYDDATERMAEWREAGEEREVADVVIEHFELVNAGEDDEKGREYIGVEAHYTYPEGTTRVDADGEVVAQGFPVGLTQRIHTVLVRDGDDGAWRAALFVFAEE